jgi:4-hydroxymandelate oxidase
MPTRREAFGALLGLATGTRVLAQTKAQRPLTAEKPPVVPPPPLPMPVGPVTLADFEPLAKKRMTHMAYEYIAGGAGDEITLRDNQAAFDRIRLHPRVLVDVSHLDTKLTLFGQALEFPILLAPTAYHRIVHPEGEIATVRGAAAAGATAVISSFATTSIEDVAKAAKEAAGTGNRDRQPGQAPSAGSGQAALWFQLYVNKDRGFTRDLVQRAEAAGCRALCVTVDSPTTGLRHRETRARFALPPGLERSNLKGLVTGAGGATRPDGSIYNVVLDPTLTWKDIEWLRGLTKVPVLIKGVLGPDVAARGAAAGVGIIVSNHGARNLDGVPATIDALPRIADAVDGRVPILMDGGVRRGNDVLKALASGASAVLIGRPYLFGLAVQGADGVAKVVQILRREFEMSMALMGRRSLKEIDRSALWR